MPLKPYAEAITVFHLPELHDYLASLNAPVGVDVVKYLFAMFAAYPLGAVFALIPSSLPLVKHLYTLAAGVILAQFVFGYEWVHCLAASGIVYAIVAGTGSIKVRDGPLLCPAPHDERELHSSCVMLMRCKSIVSHQAR